MAEILAAATAAATTLEQCIELCSRIRDAVERQRGMVELVEKHRSELSRTSTMINLVKAEKALQTDNVREVVTRLGQVAKNLQAHLDRMGHRSGGFRGFVGQLFSGRRNQEALERILKDLEVAKYDLSMYIQLANIGLTQGVDKFLRVSTSALEAVNQLLQRKLGPAHSLRTRKLLEDRPRHGDGTVELTHEDITFLASQDLMQQNGPVVQNNEVSLHALQVNSSIGEIGPPERVTTIRIEGNKATSHGIQLNHPMSMSAFLAVMHAMQPTRGELSSNRDT